MAERKRVSPKGMGRTPVAKSARSKRPPPAPGPVRDSQPFQPEPSPVDVDAMAAELESGASAHHLSPTLPPAEPIAKTARRRRLDVDYLAARARLGFGFPEPGDWEALGRFFYPPQPGRRDVQVGHVVLSPLWPPAPELRRPLDPDPLARRITLPLFVPAGAATPASRRPHGQRRHPPRRWPLLLGVLAVALSVGRLLVGARRRHSEHLPGGQPID